MRQAVEWPLLILNRLLPIETVFRREYSPSLRERAGSQFQLCSQGDDNRHHQARRDVAEST